MLMVVQSTSRHRARSTPHKPSEYICLGCPNPAFLINVADLHLIVGPFGAMNSKRPETPMSCKKPHTHPVRLHLIGDFDVECERAVLEAVAAGSLRTLLATLPWQPTSP
jgi:hypothetical protein